MFLFKVAIKLVCKKKAPPEYLSKFMPREIDSLNATCRHHNVVRIIVSFLFFFLDQDVCRVCAFFCSTYPVVAMNKSSSKHSKVSFSQAPFTRVRTNFRTDKNLHGSTLRLHGPGSAELDEFLSVQVWDLKKAGKLFDRHGSDFVRTRVNTRTVQLFAQVPYG